MSNFHEISNGDSINLDLVKRIELSKFKEGGTSNIKVTYMDCVAETVLFKDRDKAVSAYKSILNSNKK